MYTCVLPSLATCVYVGFLTKSKHVRILNQPFKVQRDKNGLTSQAEHQRSSRLFQNNSINKCKEYVRELGSQALKSEYCTYPARLLSREV